MAIPLKESALAFLAEKRVAVVGVRTTNTSDAANGIYKRMRDKGYEVFAVNPKTDTAEGDPCYPNLSAIPGGVDAVMIVLQPEQSLAVVQEAAELGIKHVWMHKAIGNSVSEAAVELGLQNGMNIIPGACPFMFIEPVDIFHRCMHGIFRTTGRIPKTVETP